MNPADVYDEYCDRIFRFMFHRIGNEKDAEDLAGQVFERVVVNIERFDPNKGAIEVWLFTIARNVLYDYFRTSKSHEQTGFETLSERVDDAPTPESSAIMTEERARLRKAMNRLSERESNIVSMKYAAGLKNTEIAKTMALSEKNVSVILCRALKKLKKELLKNE